MGSGDQVEGASGSPFIALADQWRAANEQDFGQNNFNQFLRQGGQPILFTPLVWRNAAAYQASATITEDSEPVGALRSSDLQRGVGLYEYYMKVTSGSNRNQGSVINRFS